jgi:hypothetical protein
MGPAPRQANDHAPGARDHFRRHLDQAGPPRAREALTQGVALAALVEELLAGRFVERLGR